MHGLGEPVGSVVDAVGIAFFALLQDLDVVELDGVDAVLDVVEDLQAGPSPAWVVGEVDLLEVAKELLEVFVVRPEPDLLGACRDLRQHASILPKNKRMFRTFTGRSRGRDEGFDPYRGTSTTT